MAEETGVGAPFGDLAAAYWKHYAATNEAKNRHERAETRDLFWAWEQVEEVVRRADTRSIQLLVKLADTAPDDHSLGYLGAGPLETLLTGHWEEILNPLEVAIRQNPRLRSALDNVWWSGIPLEVMDRLSKFGLRDLKERRTPGRA